MKVGLKVKVVFITFSINIADSRRRGQICCNYKSIQQFDFANHIKSAD